MKKLFMKQCIVFSGISLEHPIKNIFYIAKFIQKKVFQYKTLHMAYKVWKRISSTSEHRTVWRGAGIQMWALLNTYEKEFIGKCWKAL